MSETKNFLQKQSIPIIHTLVWIVFIIVSSTQLYYQFNFIPKDHYLKTLSFIFVFYINYALLIPKTLLKKNITTYIIASLAFITLVTFGFNILEQFLGNYIKLNSGNDFISQNPSKHYKPSLFPVLLLFFALSTSVKLVLEWYKIEKKRSTIEAQKISSELSFLRTQLNPHFLFNTLNSIYSLANKKSENTTTSIVTLAELMRYMIYEANENLIGLDKEIDYVKNYISLQLLRIKDSSGVEVNVLGSLHYKIEPMLLISFIENAFKYGTDFRGKTDIKIKITVENEELNLYVKNKISVHKQESKNSGIGIENTQNRLSLLYPDTHKLDISKQENFYIVNLNLKLKKYQ